jgi:hypothetical protein
MLLDLIIKAKIKLKILIIKQSDRLLSSPKRRRVPSQAEQIPSTSRRRHRTRRSRNHQTSKRVLRALLQLCAIPRRRKHLCIFIVSLIHLVKQLEIAQIGGDKVQV